MTAVVDEVVRVVANTVAVCIVPLAGVVREEVGIGTVWIVTVAVAVGVVPLRPVVDEGVIALLIRVAVAVRIAPSKRVVGVLVTVGAVGVVAKPVVVVVDPLGAVVWRPIAVVANTITVGVFPFA